MRYLGALFVAAPLLLGGAGFSQDAGLVAYWSFDTGNGASVADVSGNGHDGTVLGDLKRVDGLDGKAMELVGNDQAYIRCANEDGALNLAEAFTLEAWIKRTDTGTRWDGILSNGGPNRGFQLFYGEGSQALTFYTSNDESGYGPTGGAYIPIGEWMHIAATFDAATSTIRLYQNGQQTGSRTVKGKMHDLPGDFFIGRGGLYSCAFRGLIDEVKVYDRALTSDEIQIEYARFAGELPKAAPVPPVCFTNLRAERDRDTVRFDFEKADGYLKTDDGATTETKVVIIRNHCRRNDFNPGAMGGERIFDGTLNSADNRHYEYVDTLPLEDGQTYYYWVTTDGKSFRAAPAKVRKFHPDIWWSPEKINARLDAIAAKYPDRAEVKTIAHTVEGRPMNVLFVGNPNRRIVLIGAVHVSESGPEQIVGAIEGMLEDSPGLLDEVGIAAMPCNSLDRRAYFLRTGHAGYLRTNAHGVDINRNFDAGWETLTANTDPAKETYRGPQAFSEPESRAIRDLVAMSNPVAIFSFHSIGSLCNACFLYSGAAKEDEAYKARCTAITRAYAEGMYGDKADEYYSVEPFGSLGTLQTYGYMKVDVPSFDLELDKEPEARAVVYGDAVSPDLMAKYQKLHQHGLENVIRWMVQDGNRGTGNGER